MSGSIRLLPALALALAILASCAPSRDPELAPLPCTTDRECEILNGF